MLDVDHFKQVNDNYGHQIGDRALQTCVTTIQNILHPHDLLGRFGGEEFAILLQIPLKKVHLNWRNKFELKLVSNRFIFMENYQFYTGEYWDKLIFAIVPSSY